MLQQLLMLIQELVQRRFFRAEPARPSDLRANCWMAVLNPVLAALLQYTAACAAAVLACKLHMHCCTAPTCIAEVHLLQMALVVTHKVTDVAQVILRLLGIQRSREAAAGQRRNTNVLAVVRRTSSICLQLHKLLVFAEKHMSAFQPTAMSMM